MTAMVAEVTESGMYIFDGIEAVCKGRVRDVIVLDDRYKGQGKVEVKQLYQKVNLSIVHFTTASSAHQSRIPG